MTPRSWRDVVAQAGHLLVQSECIVSRMEMASFDAEAITDMVRGKLVRALCAHAVDYKILNDPSGFSMEDDKLLDMTRFRARIYMLSPAELEAMLRHAFEAGRNSTRSWEYVPKENVWLPNENP